MSLPVVSSPVDRLGRGLDDLRISVIDRCNFRCTFCMPADREYHFLRRAELLTFEELTRVARIFAGLGVRKLRITGGEPLLRAEIEKLIGMLAQIPGIDDLALTTNGRLLAKKAGVLAEAGLDRVSVSLESLDDEAFGRINGVGQGVGPILEGIDVAQRAGLGPVKINTVVMKGVNDHEIVDIARYFKERRAVVRFIEFMDVGTLNRWDSTQVVTAREILERIDAELPIEPLPRQRRSDVAERYRYVDDGVELGVISSISEPFCGDCTRARLSSDGSIYTCLFASQGHDLKGSLRAGQSDDQLEQRIRDIWSRRVDRYSEERARLMDRGVTSGDAPRVEMFRLGG